MKRFAALTVLLVLSSCATYYQSNFEFNEDFERGDLRKALSTLRSKSSEATGKKRFLYFVNNGLILSLMGQYKESNEYLEKAYLFGEDYRLNIFDEAASYLTNPNFTTYKGEDHEHLMLLYFKALNYLKLSQTEEALVECRRLNIRLQQLTDRYSSEDKYRKDAFVETLMGIIYDSDKDYNNAFIAYRNALEIYESDFSRLFGLGAPEQLKKDAIRTAKLAGLTDESDALRIKWDMEEYVPQSQGGADLIFFWHNGLSPVKAEWGINFIISRRGNMIIFSNPDLGISFPFDAGGYNERDRNGLVSMNIIRVAFPKYVERATYFTDASVSLEGKTQPLQLLEDVSKVAFKCLDERMNLELSKALLRFGIKKLSEYEMGRKDRNMGAVLGIVNALTEKADTRNWQTLPHSIYYSRVPLHEGSNNLTFTLTPRMGPPQAHEFTYEAKNGQTLFHTFSSLEISYLRNGFN